MKRLLFLPVLILFSSAVDAEIYSWTDSAGTVIFTDNAASIPAYSTRPRRAETSAGVPRETKQVKHITGKQPKPGLQAAIPGNRVKSVAAAKAKRIEESAEIEQELQGHLDGDQSDPAPPGMQQPLPKI